ASGTFPGLAQLTADVLAALRKGVPGASEAAKEVLLVGGSAQFVNFKARLQASVTELAAETLGKRAKVHFAKDRRHS
ncbi:unnamed protein product, partial [Polarella glacialis]